MAEITLSKAELVALTSYELPCKQLARLHADGFHRARIGRDGVILERAHYEAVCRGESEKPRKTANIGFLKAA
jgi:hypothetical protein